jgi:hypothetical protein
MRRVLGSFGRGKVRVRFGCHAANPSVVPRVRSDPEERNTAAALIMAPCSPGRFTGRADMPPLEALSVADYGNFFNPQRLGVVAGSAEHAVFPGETKTS